VADPTPEELERFFYLDADTLALARSKRRLHNRLGVPRLHGRFKQGIAHDRSPGWFRGER
jgi:hypothetical protein